MNRRAIIGTGIFVVTGIADGLAGSALLVSLFLAAIVSFFLHEPTKAIIVLTIIIVSGLLGFWKEYGAVNSVENLANLV